MHTETFAVTWQQLQQLLQAYTETGRSLTALNLSKEILAKHQQQQLQSKCALLNKDFVRRYAFSLQPPAGKN